MTTGNRTSWSVSPVVAAIALATAALLAAGAHGQCRYEAVVLPGEGFTLQPYAVNDAGSVVGARLRFPTYAAFLWPGEGPIILLPMPAGQVSMANDISEGGLVVGSYNGGEGNRGFLWDGKETRTLGLLPGHYWSEAHGVTEDGIAAGFSLEPKRPVAWIGEKIEDLSPYLEPFYRAEASDISDAGHVVGHYRDEQRTPNQAFLLNRATGETVRIGAIPGGEDGEARAVNNRGRALVRGDDLNGQGKTFLWTSGRMIELAALPGDALAGARDLNDRGLVVGGSVGDDQVRAAVIWHREQPFDLNALISAEGVDLRFAWAISSAGILACTGRDASGRLVAVRLTPLDPPAGDVTGDCRVDFIDLLTLLSEWGPCTYCIADLDGDRTVGPADLEIVLATWG